MAVTQNLARLSDSLIAECATSTAVLDDVCSFRALASEDYLDLDWAPTLLREVAATADVDPELQLALAQAMNGHGEINPLYRDMPDTVWEHPVSSLGAVEVEQITLSLDVLVQSDFITDEAIDNTLDRLERLERPDEPREYLRRHLEALCEFYRGASARHLGTAMWWD